LREILASDGSIYVHLDWRIVYIDLPFATKREFRGSQDQKEGGQLLPFQETGQDILFYTYWDIVTRI